MFAQHLLETLRLFRMNKAKIVDLECSKRELEIRVVEAESRIEHGEDVASEF